MLRGLMRRRAIDEEAWIQRLLLAKEPAARWRRIINWIRGQAPGKGTK